MKCIQCYVEEKSDGTITHKRTCAEYTVVSRVASKSTSATKTSSGTIRSTDNSTPGAKD